MTVPLAKVTVLILDDNPLVLKLGRALLEREGCTVLTASSWIEFNHVLAGNSPDIIFLDVNLPSIKGNRLSEVLKSRSEEHTSELQSPRNLVCRLLIADNRR